MRKYWSPWVQGAGRRCKCTKQEAHRIALSYQGLKRADGTHTKGSEASTWKRTDSF